MVHKIETLMSAYCDKAVPYYKKTECHTPRILIVDRIQGKW